MTCEVGTGIAGEGGDLRMKQEGVETAALGRMSDHRKGVTTITRPRWGGTSIAGQEGWSQDGE